MASNWTGTVFVYIDNNDQQYIATALPEGAIIPASDVREHQATGPRLPMGFPQSLAVDDADQWIRDRENEGFTFQRIHQ